MGLAYGKVNGQKAFMTGALKVKGNVMLAVSTYHGYTRFSDDKGSIGGVATARGSQW